ncbi:MAG: PLP-dependent transferase [Gemmatimonadota bacterium]
MRFDPEDVALCLADDEVPAPAPSPGGAPADVWRAPDGARSTATPIVQTSLFTFPTFQALIEGLSAEHRHTVYTRGQNPTVEVVERKLAALERGEACKAFGSGMAAINAVMTGLLRAGDHVLFVNNTYGPTLQLAEHLARFGVEHDVVLDGSLDAVRAALKPNTTLVWLESPGTMPFLLNGGVLAPFDAWLLLRGMRTLPTRLRQHEADALAVARFLDGHPAVRRVHHPALAGETAGARGARDDGGAAGADSAAGADAHIASPAKSDGRLGGSSGLFSFELVKDDFESVRRVLDALEHIRLGVSWGGVESLAISPARPGNEADLDAKGIPRGLVRLSVGLEGADVLIADLDAALASVS